MSIIFAKPSGGSGGGGGDMTKAVYDTNNDGIVDVAAVITGQGDLATLDTVDTAQIDNGAVTSSKIANGTIGTSNLSTAVNTSLGLADSAVQPGDLATVATTGDYNDLGNKPDLSVYDEVEQHADLASFPVTGNSAKFYLAQDTGIMYRWAGSAYAVISGQLALGETSSTAYRGDRGKTAYDHSQVTTGNPHNVLATQITDFDTEVSNNTDVSANTAARHDAVTVADSSEIDLTLTGQQISASIVAGSIDETKLDTSVNASLDLADSALQSESDTLDSVTGRGATTTNNVSVGAITTASAGVPLTLNSTDSNGLKFAYQDNGTIAGYIGASTILDNSFYIADTNAQTQVVIKNSTGRVGIGTTSPAQALDVDGNIAVSGTVDGRDIATDGTKLDGIEASADVTDATNVAAAGAVMESDVDAKGDIFVATADNTLTRLPVGTNDQVLTVDSAEASGVKWATPGGGGGGVSNISIGRLGGNQSVAASTYVKIAFNVDEYDPDGNFDTTNNRYIAPNTGVYEVDCYVYTTYAISYREYKCFIYKNGVAYRTFVYGLTTTGDFTFANSCTLSLTASDYIEIYIYHTSSTMSVRGGADNGVSARLCVKQIA